MDIQAKCALADASDQQEQLWLAHQIVDSPAMFNVPIAVHMRGRLDKALLQTALNRVVNRHEALRSGLIESNGQVHRIIAPEVHVPIREHDLSCADVPADPAAGKNELVGRALEEIGSTRFELSQPPLVRADLIRLAQAEHTFMLTFHHAVLDLVSLGIFLAEIGASFDGPNMAAGVPPQAQYSAFVNHQRGRANDAFTVMARDYWVSLAARAPAQLNLPARGCPSDRTDLSAARLASVVPAPYPRLVRDAARSCRATPFAVLLAVWQVVLASYCGDRRFLVGVPFANRTVRGLDRVVGFCTNTLPILADLDLSQTPRETTAHVWSRILRGLAYQDVSPGDVARDSSGKGTARASLFDTVFAYEVARHHPSWGDLEITVDKPVSPALRQSISLEVTDYGESLSLLLEYRAGQLRQSVMQDMLCAYADLLGLAVNSFDASWRDLLARRSSRPGPDPFQDTAAVSAHAALPGHVSGLLEDFLAVAREDPQRPAVVTGQSVRSYGELDTVTSELAGKWRAALVARSPVIAVSASDPDLLVQCLVASWKLGATVLLLDPRWSRDRLSGVLAAARPAVRILGAGALPDKPTPDDLQSPGIEALDDSMPRLAPVRVPHLSQLSHVSVKPGREEVLLAGVSYGSLASQTRWLRQHYRLGATDRVLVAVDPADSTWLAAAWWSLTSGACLTIAGGTSDDVTELEDISVTSSITALHAASGVLGRLVTGERLLRNPSLRLVGCGGPLPAVVAAEARKQSGATFFRHYGVAEAGGMVACGPLAGIADQEESLVAPAGQAIAGCAVRVVDQDMLPAPREVAGNVYLSGECLRAAVYLGQPAVTAETFVPDPWGTPGSRMLRTGDIGYLTGDGVLWPTGRVGDELMIGGYRVQPWLIESVMTSVPGVEKAIVIAVGTATGERESLVAVVQAPEDPEQVIGRVRDKLKGLPAHFCPGRFEAFPALPVGTDGQLDRGGISGMLDEVSRPALTLSADETTVAVHAVWSEILASESLDSGSDFFALGGSSLSAARVVNRLARDLSIPLTIRDMLDCPTLADFVVLVRQRREGLA